MMAAKSGNTCIDSLETIRHVPMLLSQVVGVGLFWACSYPRGCESGAVNKSLSTAVRPIFDEMSVMEDVRRCRRGGCLKVDGGLQDGVGVFGVV